ncbi:hypothetical protein [endosymbiont of Lamellibrachia barhami]|uniref:hypothetical protein n=1 Tax=endosymbiont of Lamellibrachia barhami TaxID=205975 RepID=UPI0015AC37FB|nr:hypothetical protein [endosymbiont of Lamellibrachia barhami]
MKTSFVIIALSLLAGCAGFDRVSGGESDVYAMPPVGTTIVLKASLFVPAGQTRVYLQGGAVVSKAKMDRYLPNCNFEIRTLSEDAQEIRPESFIVSRLQREMAQVVMLDAPLLVAGLNLAGLDGGVPMVFRGVHLWISSDIQPEVMRLTCRGVLEDMIWARPPSIQEMRTAMGDKADLIFPE